MHLDLGVKSIGIGMKQGFESQCYHLFISFLKLFAEKSEQYLLTEVEV